MKLNRRHLLSIAAASALAPALPATAQGAPRVLCFGDSLTAGYGLGADQGLVPQLSDWLTRADRPATLLNGGLSGDTTYGGRIRIELAMPRHEPDAVIVELGGNDMLRGWTAADAEPNLDAILTRAGRGGRPLLLVGIQAPKGPDDWRADWAAMWPRIAARHGALLLPDLYAPLAAVAPDLRGPLLQPDGIHASAEGVRRIVAELGPVTAQLIGRLAA
ncbi:arylesterase [Paracoccus zeaxanthinifaciens]|uniref:arylesterase n=1 Tax=Paracoccus zeaxanthinifaciens TaxID=187400 RepID=UPI0003B46910|nr:arylesterase [Paracoccus zeaxanthinifaciens]